MKKILSLLFAGLMSISGSLMAIPYPEVVDVDNSRTSMDYAPQIRELLNKIEHHKWEAENGLGYHFLQVEAPYESDANSTRIFVNVKTYLHGDLIGENVMYFIQSKYKGYIDIVDIRTSERLRVRYLPEEKAFGLFRGSRGDDKYLMVKDFNTENPNPQMAPMSERYKGFVF